ncbi:Unknown protein [Striga hermonthica]|uniref:Reverse transcriptase zinc-binding domain-containing protein n=1 Tax=Striga hermonthica TaxID=68872 RepID=A0A9N7NI44_STRHE|nr:Unknown protein [Striga hermonthica]
MWHSWLKVRDTFQLGLRYEVKNRSRIKIYDHPWIPGLPGFKPKSRPPANSNISWVSELIDVTGRNWKRHVLQDLFSEEEQAAILKVKSLNPGEHDKLIWHCGKKGTHSVAASYDYLVKEKWKNLDIAEPSKGHNEIRGMRKRLWGLKIKGKIKHFIWKCLNNILPVSVNLAKRGIHIEERCKGTKSGGEGTSGLPRSRREARARASQGTRRCEKKLVRRLRWSRGGGGVHTVAGLGGSVEVEAVVGFRE